MFEMKAISRLARAPNAIRASMSRPSESVPRTWPELRTPSGSPAGVRPSTGVAYGSPKIGANTASSTPAVRIATPAMNVRRGQVAARALRRDPEAVVVSAVDTGVVEVPEAVGVAAHDPVHVLAEDTGRVLSDLGLDLGQERVSRH